MAWFARTVGSFLRRGGFLERPEGQTGELADEMYVEANEAMVLTMKTIYNFLENQWPKNRCHILHLYTGRPPHLYRILRFPPSTYSGNESYFDSSYSQPKTFAPESGDEESVWFLETLSKKFRSQ